MRAVCDRFETETRAALGPVWGRFDCLQLALACAGRDDLAAGLPKYSSRAGALRGLKRLGCADLAALLDRLGVEIPAASALPGDAALEARAGLEALGVVAGPVALFLAPGGGLTPRPFARAWRL